MCALETEKVIVSGRKRTFETEETSIAHAQFRENQLFGQSSFDQVNRLDSILIAYFFFYWWKFLKITQIEVLKLGSIRIIHLSNIRYTIRMLQDYKII